MCGISASGKNSSSPECEPQKKSAHSCKQPSIRSSSVAGLCVFAACLQTSSLALVLTLVPQSLTRSTAHVLIFQPRIPVQDSPAAAIQVTHGTHPQHLPAASGYQSVVPQVTAAHHTRAQHTTSTTQQHHHRRHLAPPLAAYLCQLVDSTQRTDHSIRVQLERCSTPAMHPQQLQITPLVAVSRHRGNVQLQMCVRRCMRLWDQARAQFRCLLLFLWWTPKQCIAPWVPCQMASQETCASSS